MKFKHSWLSYMDGEPWFGEREHAYAFHLVAVPYAGVGNAYQFGGNATTLMLAKTCRKCGKTKLSGFCTIDRTECPGPGALIRGGA